MISDVATRNVATNANEDVRLITQGVQTGNPNESEEWSFDRSKGDDYLHALTLSEIHAPLPPINNAKPSYF